MNGDAPRIPIDANTGLPSGNPVRTKPAPACYGVLCPHRGQCVAYEQLGLIDGHAIASCQVGQTWPLFVKRTP